MNSLEEYAVSTWLYESESLEAALGKISAAGFRKVELWGNRVHVDPRVGPRPAAVRLALESAGLEAHSVHAPFDGLGPLRPGFIDSWRGLLQSSIDLTAAIGAPLMVAHVLNRLEYDWGEGDLPVLHEFFSGIAAYARKRGVGLLLENLADGPGRASFRCSLANISRVFGDLDVGYCLDIGHSPLSGEDVMESIAVAGERLFSVHVNNNDGRRDLHDPPDTGILDWPSIRLALRGAGYRGDFVLEVAGHGDPDSVLARLGAALQPKP